MLNDSAKMEGQTTPNDGCNITYENTQPPWITECNSDSEEDEWFFNSIHRCVHYLPYNPWCLIIRFPITTKIPKTLILYERFRYKQLYTYSLICKPTSIDIHVPKRRLVVAGQRSAGEKAETRIFEVPIQKLWKACTWSPH